jgi:hypothetical protein
MLVIIQFFMFSADKMLCVRVSGMLLLQKTRSNGSLLHASVWEGLPFTLWAAEWILASVFWRLQVIYFTYTYM